MRMLATQTFLPLVAYSPALALGAGSESRIPMGVAIIGGLLFGTGLTLYVVPAVYSYLTREITAAIASTGFSPAR